MEQDELLALKKKDPTSVANFTALIDTLLHQHIRKRKYINEEKAKASKGYASEKDLA